MKLTYQVLRNTEALLEQGGRRREEQRLEKLKGDFQPVSASGQLFSSINESRVPRSGAWVEAELQAWWTGSQPLLWIRGGPGMGKSEVISGFEDHPRSFGVGAGGLLLLKEQRCGPAFV